MRRKIYLKRVRNLPCYFCSEGQDPSYKLIDLLQQFLTPRRKIIPRRGTGLCAKHQRRLALAVKRARNIALL